MRTDGFRLGEHRPPIFGPAYHFHDWRCDLHGS